MVSPLYRFVLSVFLCFRHFVIFCLLCTALFYPCSCGALFSLFFRLHNPGTAVVLAGGTSDSGRSMSVFLLILVLCLWVRRLLVLFTLSYSYTRARPLSTLHSSLRQCPLPVGLSLSSPQAFLLSAAVVCVLSSRATPQPDPRNANVETGRGRRSRCTLVIAVD